MSGDALFRGGPKDGQILPAIEDDEGLIAFDDPEAYYRLMAETASTEAGELPVAVHTGHLRPHVH